MKQSRTKNSVRNIIWAIIYKVLSMLLPFVVRSVMIYKLGAQYTGLNSLFTSLLTMLSLAELGFSSAMVYCMYEPIHNDDYRTINALLNFYRKVYTVVGIIILTLGVALIPFLTVFVHREISGDINLYYLYAIYLGNTVISYFLFAYKSSLLTAYQRNDKISIIGMICHLGLYSLQIVVLLITANFYLYAILLPLSTVVMNLCYEIVTRKLYPNIRCEGTIDSELKEKIKKRVMGMMLYKFSSTTRTSFDSVAISSFLGLLLLTQYQNYFMIVSSILGILAMINTSITASVGDSIVEKTTDSTYKDFKKFVFIYMWISGWFSVCIGMLIQPFMRLWMGQELMLPMSMAILFAVYFYAQTMGDMVFLYRTAAGLWWQDRIRPIVEAAANIILNIVFVKIWGLHGIILATIITLLGINFLWGAFILFKHYFNKSMNEYVFIQAKQAVLTGIAAILCFLICMPIKTNPINTLIIRLFICVSIPNIIFWMFYRNSNSFIEAKGFIKNVAGSFLRHRSNNQ